MTDDLVKCLRNRANGMMQWVTVERMATEAADRIEQLQTEVKRLEQQLKMARRLAYRPQPEYPPEIGVPHLRED
jgi:HAMP domain-containing protein